MLSGGGTGHTGSPFPRPSALIHGYPDAPATSPTSRTCSPDTTEHALAGGKAGWQPWWPQNNAASEGTWPREERALQGVPGASGHQLEAWPLTLSGPPRGHPSSSRGRSAGSSLFFRGRLRDRRGGPRGGASYLLASEITLLVVSASCWHLIFSAVAFSNADVRLLKLALSSWGNRVEGLEGDGAAAPAKARPGVGLPTKAGRDPCVCSRALSRAAE